MARDLTGKAKSCPMCGSKRIYMDEPNYDVIFSVKIYCADCGLLGFKNFHKSAKNPIEKTLEYWNTRVPVTVDKEDFNPHETAIGKRLDAGFVD